MNATTSRAPERADRAYGRRSDDRESIREPEHVIDHARAEAALSQKVGFEVARQLSALCLRSDPTLTARSTVEGGLPVLSNWG